ERVGNRVEYPSGCEGNEEPPGKPVTHGSGRRREKTDRKKRQDGFQVVVMSPPDSFDLLIGLARLLPPGHIVLRRDEHAAQIPEDGRGKASHGHLEHENRGANDEQTHRRIGKARAQTDASSVRRSGTSLTRGTPRARTTPLAAARIAAARRVPRERSFA